MWQDLLYMKRKEGGRGLISVEDCITTERRGSHDYMKQSKEDMLSGALKENVIEEGETKEEFTKRKMDERKNILHEGRLQGQFVEKTRNMHLKKGTENLVFEVKRINHVEAATLQVVIGALGTVPKRLIRSIELVGIGDIIASQHPNDSTVRNNRNTMQGDESLSYKS